MTNFNETAAAALAADPAAATVAPAPTGAAPYVDEIVVVAYDAAWPHRFIVESQLIRLALADLQPAVEHIGSTSVPGLAAKATIDMLVGVRSLADFGAHADLLMAYGYEYVPEYERALPDRRFFKRVVRGIRTHHVHVVEFGGTYWKRYMAFRDSLRRDARLAARYESLKRLLAARHRFDRDAYTNGKTGFVESVLAGTAQPRADHPAAAHARGTAMDTQRRCRERIGPGASAPSARAGLQLRPHFGFAS